MRCKQFIFVSLAGVVLAASLAGCGGGSPRLIRCGKLCGCFFRGGFLCRCRSCPAGRRIHR